MIVWAHRLQPGDIIYRRANQEVDELVLDVKITTRTHALPSDMVELRALCRRARRVVSYHLPSYEQVVIDIPNR